MMLKTCLSATGASAARPASMVENVARAAAPARHHRQKARPQENGRPRHRRAAGAPPSPRHTWLGQPRADETGPTDWRRSAARISSRKPGSPPLLSSASFSWTLPACLSRNRRPGARYHERWPSFRRSRRDIVGAGAHPFRVDAELLARHVDPFTRRRRQPVEGRITAPIFHPFGAIRR